MGKEKMSEGLLVVISSPSGGGKTTVRDRLLTLLPDLVYSVSCTTRRPRAGEVEGRDYFFLSPEDFQKRRERGQFLEWAEVFGESYGTPSEVVDEALSQGRDVLLDLDTQGALAIQSKRNVILIFILPPSLEILKSRLYRRNTDSEGEIGKRLSEARRELGFVGQYDYVLMNDHVERTVEKIKAIILAERHRTRRQAELIQLFQDSLSGLSS